MFIPISQEALTKLIEEINTSRHFTPAVMNRLKKEDPHYERMAMFFAKKVRDELGDAGFKLALDNFADAYRVMELCHERTLLAPQDDTHLFTPISKEALTKLVKEMTESMHFTPWVMNRLKNEDPHYAYMAEFFARKAREELGGAGFKAALDHFAYAYRIIELGQQYKAPAHEYPEIEPPQSPEEIAYAEAEFAALLAVCRQPLKK